MIVARSTAIQEIYLTVHMSSKNLPKSGDSTILQAHQSILNRRVQLRGQCRLRNVS